MSLSVFHYPSAAEASAGSEVLLDGPEGHHASTVKRLRVGETVVLTDGSGIALDAEVTEVGRRVVTMLVRSRQTSARPSLRVTVAQAIPKGDRGELAIELMTEVGVDRFVPWAADRGVSRWNGDKAARGRAKWQGAASAAAKQSRRVWWPEVDELSDVNRVAEVLQGSARSFVLHEGAQATLVDQLGAPSMALTGEIALVVGPEGGLTPAELEQFKAAGATPVRLGETVLRASTAGVVAATLVLAGTPTWRCAPPDSDEGITSG